MLGPREQEDAPTLRENTQATRSGQLQLAGGGPCPGPTWSS